MRFSEVRQLVRVKRPETDPTKRRLGACLDIDDVRELARRRLPAAVFDYVDGGAEEEVTLAENRASFLAWRFVPRLLQDVGQVDVSVDLFGRRFGAPLALCPTGYTRMVHSEGESAVARAAGARQLPYALSTAGTTSIEDLSAGRHGDLWFQLFVLRDRGLTRSLLERAEAAGYAVLEVTVDTHVSGWRKRDISHGLTVPPALRAHAVADIALHVGYWVRTLRSPALRFANLDEPDVGEAWVSPANMANLFDPTVTWDDIAEVRGWWRRPMLLKGPLSAEDCKRAASLGINGVHLSNHGGRQLDRCVPSAELVRPAREALGDDAAIVLDSGIRHGADIVVALAMGADLCAIGRPYLYGLAAAGEPGVAKVLDLLVDQVKRTMKLMGISSVRELRDNGAQLLRRRES